MGPIFFNIDILLALYNLLNIFAICMSTLFYISYLSGNASILSFSFPWVYMYNFETLSHYFS